MSLNSPNPHKTRDGISPYAFMGRWRRETKTREFLKAPTGQLTCDTQRRTTREAVTKQIVKTEI